MYQVKDYVVYGNEGVCQVEAIEMMDFTKSGKERPYYVLQPVNRNGKVYTPVDTKVFIRPVISRETAEDLIKQIPSIKAETGGPTNAAILKNKYTETLQENNCEDLIQLIKSIYHKGSVAEEKNKKMGQTDKFFLRKAEELLYGEFAVVFNMSQGKVREYVEGKVDEITANS